MASVLLKLKNYRKSLVGIANFIMIKNLSPAHPILIVDDDPSSLFNLETLLHCLALDNIVSCLDSRDVTKVLAQQPAAVVILDLMMPHLPGEELLKTLVRDYPRIPVIVVTGREDIATAVRCIKQGAFDYIVKPIEQGRLLASVKHALLIQELRDENEELKKRYQKLNRPNGTPHHHNGHNGSINTNSDIRFPDTLPTLKKFNELLVKEALYRAAGNQSLAGQMLGVSQQAVSKRIKSFDNA